MITYSVTRWDISCCHHDHPAHAGFAESCILGITATHDSGVSAYKDERISISPCVELAEFEKNAEKWIEGQIGSGGWYLELQTRIASQLKAPEPAPSNREKPDFAKMTIGDGYRDLPSEEKVEEKAEEKPAEESKPAAKKKATKKKEEAKEESEE